MWEPVSFSDMQPSAFFQQAHSRNMPIHGPYLLPGWLLWACFPSLHISFTIHLMCYIYYYLVYCWFSTESLNYYWISIFLQTLLLVKKINKNINYGFFWSLKFKVKSWNSGYCVPVQWGSYRFSDFLLPSKTCQKVTWKWIRDHVFTEHKGIDFFHVSRLQS